MLHEKIELLCSKKGVSISKLENDLGFSKGSICKWKESMPAADKLYKAADYLGVTVESLLEEGG